MRKHIRNLLETADDYRETISSVVVYLLLNLKWIQLPSVTFLLINRLICLCWYCCIIYFLSLLIVKGVIVIILSCPLAYHLCLSCKTLFILSLLINHSVQFSYLHWHLALAQPLNLYVVPLGLVLRGYVTIFCLRWW